MRRIVATLLFLITVTALSAQSYHAVNLDAKTVAAMAGAYVVESETERMTRNDIDSILGHYTKSTLSTIGILLSKRNDRNAMRDAGIFGTEENHYYQRILYLVKDGIMPKLIVVAAKMVKQPDNALYWGPYLMKTTKNVEQLCKQFELVVTNGKLSFKDVAFLVVNEKLQKVFDLSQLGNVNWKELLEKVGEFDVKAAKEDIKNDINKLGSVLATAGKGVLDSNMKDVSAIGKIFKSKPEEIFRLYQTFKSKYEGIRNAGNIKNLLMSVILTNDADAVSRLFQIDTYSIAGYISNYIKDLQGQHYRQRWYVYSEDKGKKVLAVYQPSHPSNTNNSDNWAGWLYKENYMKIHTPDYPTLSTSEYNQLKSTAENSTGWNTARKEAYQRNRPGHTITLQYETASYSYSRDKGGGLFSSSTHWRGKHWSVYMKVVDDWDIKHEVHEETFDSESMDEETFRKRMASQLKYYNSLENDKPAAERVTYKLGFDEKKYYTVADEKKMKGCSSVTFSAKCGDGANLAEGSFNWKENGNQGKQLEDPKSKNFALDYTPSSSNESAELQNKKRGYQAEIKNVEEKIRANDKKLQSLISQINQAKLAKDEKKVQELREQYNSLSGNQDALRSQLSGLRNDVAAVDAAIAEYYKDLSEDTGSPYRINSNMKELEGMFHLSWQDGGEWVNGGEQYTFVRHAYSEQIKGQVTYIAVLKLQKGPSHFLGIRIHRAILSVDYKLTASYSSENVIETMKLDMSMSEKERAEKVNARRKKLMEDMPDCSITVKYNYSQDVGEEEDPDAIHLLWASDRLDVAREVEYQLSNIYAQLVLLEKVMNDRQAIKDFLTNNILNPITRQARGTIAEYALGRWQAASDEAKKTSASPSGKQSSGARRK